MLKHVSKEETNCGIHSDSPQGTLSRGQTKSHGELGHASILAESHDVTAFLHGDFGVQTENFVQTEDFDISTTASSSSTVLHPVPVRHETLVPVRTLQSWTVPGEGTSPLHCAQHSMKTPRHKPSERYKLIRSLSLQELYTALWSRRGPNFTVPGLVPNQIHFLGLSHPYGQSPPCL